MQESALNHKNEGEYGSNMLLESSFFGEGTFKIDRNVPI